MSKLEIKLSTSKDWDAWISIVESKATGLLVWDEVNRDIGEKPKLTDKPTVTSVQIPENATEDETNRLNSLQKLRRQKYTQDKELWKDEHEGTNKILE